MQKTLGQWQIKSTTVPSAQPNTYRLVDLISRNALASVHSPTTGANAHRLITIFVNPIKPTSPCILDTTDSWQSQLVVRSAVEVVSCDLPRCRVDKGFGPTAGSLSRPIHPTRD